jgi:Scaffold protein Nfu/NifU N terminal
MFIETEGTPNPATLKFLPGRYVMGAGTADFASSASAERSPLAGALFALPGVARVFLGGDFITVTKSDETAWQALKPQVLAAIMEHFVAGRPVIEGADDDDLVGRSPRKTRRSSRRSRNCWTPVCVRRWPAMAATSCSAATARAS